VADIRLLHRCIGVSFREEDGYCALKQDVDLKGPTLESDEEYASYLAFVNDS